MGRSFTGALALYSLSAMMVGGKVATAHAADNPMRVQMGATWDEIWSRLDGFSDALAAILTMLPQLPRGLADALEAVLASTGDPRGPHWPLARAVLIMLLVLFTPALIRFVGGEPLARRLRGKGIAGTATREAAFEVVALAATLAVAVVLAGRLVKGPTLTDQLAVALVTAAAQWRFWMLVPLLLLRPGRPQLRLVQADDGRAREAYNTAGVLLALGFVAAKLLPLLVDAGLPVLIAQAGGLVLGLIIALGAIGGLRRFFAGAHRGRAAIGVAAEAVAALAWLTWTFGLTMLDFRAYNAVFWALGAGAFALVADRLIGLAIAERGQAQEQGRRLHVLPVVRHVLVAVVAAYILVMLARSWLVDVLGLFASDRWHIVDQAIVMALTVLVAGYIAYELLHAWTTARFGQHGLPVLPGQDEDAAGAPPATRLSSIMPLLRGFFGVLIVVTAVLLALSHLGVNISPLLAGAGIFGLAFSFGSQTLVRDIVSGAFFIADDAFRVGEYIEAGRYKGTVERILIRSVRLRHQNGQIHTVPYGQLGAVTNFSRDYATVKFNLRLARDTDVDQVRKLAKRVGQEMLEDEELAREFLAPLKLQGVADVQENALVCRFKFTVRPGRPTWVQREAIKRLYRTFTDNGVAFASNAVVVQAAAGLPSETAAAAASIGATAPMAPDQGEKAPPDKMTA